MILHDVQSIIFLTDISDALYTKSPQRKQIEHIIEKHNALHLLVNNAGGQFGKWYSNTLLKRNTYIQTLTSLQK